MISEEEKRMNAAMKNADLLLYYAYAVDLGKQDEVQSIHRLAEGHSALAAAMAFLVNRVASQKSYAAVLLTLRAERKEGCANGQ